MAFTSALGLFLAAAGLFFTASQVHLTRQLAKSEFMREFYNSIQPYNDMQLKLINGGEWRRTATSGPKTEEEWFRLQRYMGLLEQIDHWHRDGIMELAHIDSAYSHRIKAIVTHPAIRARLLEREAYRWGQFLDLVAALETMPSFRALHYDFPSRSAVVPPEERNRNGAKALGSVGRTSVPEHPGT